jgi:hypothetical protein
MRGGWNRGQRRPFCKNGHLMSGANLVILIEKHRTKHICQICRARRNRKKRSTSVWSLQTRSTATPTSMTDEFPVSSSPARHQDCERFSDHFAMCGGLFECGLEPERPTSVRLPLVPGLDQRHDLPAGVPLSEP